MTPEETVGKLIAEPATLQLLRRSITEKSRRRHVSDFVADVVRLLLSAVQGLGVCSQSGVVNST